MDNLQFVGISFRSENLYNIDFDSFSVNINCYQLRAVEHNGLVLA